MPAGVMVEGSSGALVYVGIAFAAIIEGEVAYIAAATLVASGRLEPIPVVIAGTIGAAVGDQAYFYLFRGRVPRWMARFPSLERRTAPVLALVRRRAALMVLFIRFAPGLRVALAAACAYVQVPPLMFSVLNTIAAFVWAVTLLALVGWAGPATLARFGLGGWRGALAIGLLIIATLHVVSRFERRSLGIDSRV
jgi:membrane protein DedA with SNARE-associated domain